MSGTRSVRETKKCLKMLHREGELCRKTWIRASVPIRISRRSLILASLSIFKEMFWKSKVNSILTKQVVSCKNVAPQSMRSLQESERTPWAIRAVSPPKTNLAAIKACRVRIVVVLVLLRLARLTKEWMPVSTRANSSSKKETPSNFNSMPQITSKTYFKWKQLKETKASRISIPPL